MKPVGFLLHQNDPTALRLWHQKIEELSEKERDSYTYFLHESVLLIKGLVEKTFNPGKTHRILACNLAGREYSVDLPDYCLGTGLPSLSQMFSTCAPFYHFSTHYSKNPRLLIEDDKSLSHLHIELHESTSSLPLITESLRLAYGLGAQSDLPVTLELAQKHLNVVQADPLDQKRLDSLEKENRVSTAPPENHRRIIL
ncbi:MAG: hypothetical protein AAF558_13545 [Verrucomicrobiota bacterium]